MFLHLGNNYMVRKDKIIAILDMETTKNSQISRNFLSNILKNNRVQRISEVGKEKSIIITDDSFYLSPITSSTLQKRSITDIKFDYIS